MTIFGRFNVKVVASAGLCGAAIALGPHAAAAPLITGGHACIQGMAGESGPPAAAAGGPLAAAGGPLAAAGGPVAAGGPLPATGGPVAAGGPLGADVCSSASAPLTGMAGGVPLAAPGPVVAPVGAPVPAGAPVGAPVPVGAPLIALGPVGAPLPASAPLIDMDGSYGGKGDPTGPAPAGAPVPGQPVLPGPSSAPPNVGAGRG